MTAAQLTAAYCVGGGLLGFWALVRFPEFAPTTIRGALLALAAAFVVMAVAPTGLQALIDGHGRAGGLLGLTLVVLPALTAIFWAGGCVLRAFQRSMMGHR